MDGEHALMPNGNERSMQWAALYSTSSPSSTPLGLYIGAHSPAADLMMLLMQGGYCPPPPPPGFRPNGYDINATIRHGVDSGSAGGDVPDRRGLDNMSSWSDCAHACGSHEQCRAWVWNNSTGDCCKMVMLSRIAVRLANPKSITISDPKTRAVAPRKYPSSRFDVFGCSPSYPPKGCTDTPLAPPPPYEYQDDCGSFAGLRWLHFPDNSLEPTSQWTMTYDVVLAGFEGE